MKLRPAKEIHAETLEARETIWKDFRASVAEQIEVAKSCGRFLVRLKIIHEDISDPAPMVDELKVLGYTANLTTDDDSGKVILVSWRTPK